MNGFMLDYLQRIVVILHYNMMSVDVSLEFIEAEAD